MLTLPALAAVVAALGEQLGAPAHLLPTFGGNDDFARPEIRVDEAGYHFVVVERGQELQHTITTTLEELLFQVFEGVTFSMASNYEVAHRVGGQDSRIQLFARQVELLGWVSPAFAARQRAHLQPYLPGVNF